VKRILLIFIIFYSGCVSPKPRDMSTKEVNCNQKVKPKTLLFLEQQYRCNSNK